MSTFSDFMELLDKPHQYGHYIAACCPFHNENRPSFFVYPDGFRCSSCGQFGSLEYLLKYLSDKSGLIIKKEAPAWNNPFTSWLKKSPLEKVLIQAWQLLKQNPSQGSYLHNRRISSKYMQKFGIGWRDNWFTFPIRDLSNKIVGAVARAGDGNTSLSKYVVPHGQDPNLLYIPSLINLKSSNYIYLTFGIIDAVSLAILGLPSMSTTNGKRISPDALSGFRKLIYIIPDKGEEKDAMILASHLGWRGKAKILNYLDDTKDLNDVFKLYPEKVMELLK